MRTSFDPELMPEDDRLVEAFMVRLAAAPGGEHSQLAPDVLWWKAQLLRRWELEKRVHAPLDVIEPVQIAAGLAAAALVAAWALPSLVKVLSFIHM